jgi:hypothetical protein
MLADSESNNAEHEGLVLIESESSYDRLQLRIKIDVEVLREKDIRLTIDETSGSETGLAV